MSLAPCLLAASQDTIIDGIDGGSWRRITLGDGGSREKKTIQRRMSSWRMALMGRAMRRGREERRRPVVVLLEVRDMTEMR